MSQPDASTWLFEVEDVFDISGPDFIVVCPRRDDQVLCVGDQLIFLCSDGDTVTARIRFFPMISLTRPRDFTALGIAKTEQTKRIGTGAQVFRQVKSQP